MLTSRVSTVRSFNFESLESVHGTSTDPNADVLTSVSHDITVTAASGTQIRITKGAVWSLSQSEELRLFIWNDADNAKIAIEKTIFAVYNTWKGLHGFKINSGILTREEFAANVHQILDAATEEGHGLVMDDRGEVSELEVVEQGGILGATAVTTQRFDSHNNNLELDLSVDSTQVDEVAGLTDSNHLSVVRLMLARRCRKAGDVCKE